MPQNTVADTKSTFEVSGWTTSNVQFKILFERLLEDANMEAAILPTEVNIGRMRQCEKF